MASAFSAVSTCALIAGRTAIQHRQDVGVGGFADANDTGDVRGPRRQDHDVKGPLPSAACS